MKPLTHQIQILKELETKNKALIHVASGAGKTHTVAFDVLKKKPTTFLYIVHKNEILFQSINIFKQVCGWNDSQIGIINAQRKDFDKPFLFATNYALYRNTNLIKTNRKTKYIVIDEFHHAAAPTYKKILEYFEPKFLYGLTATPDRHDLKNIKNIIENNVVGNIDIFTGIKQKILCPFYYRGLYDNIDYKNIRWNGYKYVEFDLDKYLLVEKRDKAVIDEYRKWILPEKRLTIGFCNSVKHVERMVEKFNVAGIRAEGITYKEPLDKRIAVLQGFRAHLYEVLFTRDILNEGVDFPECEALMFLRPTYSKTVFLQQLGRGLRKRHGKRNVLVLDFLGNYKNVQKVREYLQELTHSTPKVATTTGGEERTKPIYRMDVPTRVEFDSRIIDIMNLAHLYSSPRSEEQILAYFDKVLPKETPFPSLGKINRKNGYEIGQAIIRHRFGTYYNLLLKLGRIDGFMKHFPYFTKKDFESDYKKIKEILGGRVPKDREVIKLNQKGLIKITLHSIYTQYGSCSKFIRAMGDTPLRPQPYKNSNKVLHWTGKEMMVEYYNKAKQILKQEYPPGKDMLKLHPNFLTAIKRYFNGRYYSFLEYAEKKKGDERICIICGYKFIAPFTFQRFRSRVTCSKKCRRNRSAILNGMREKKCNNCSRKYCILDRKKYMKFCSETCRNEYPKRYYREIKKQRLLMMKNKKNEEAIKNSIIMS
jgi:superfamily II DNA or RNA helicase